MGYVGFYNKDYSRNYAERMKNYKPVTQQAKDYIKKQLIKECTALKFSGKHKITDERVKFLFKENAKMISYFMNKNQRGVGFDPIMATAAAKFISMGEQVKVGLDKKINVNNIIRVR